MHPAPPRRCPTAIVGAVVDPKRIDERAGRDANGARQGKDISEEGKRGGVEGPQPNVHETDCEFLVPVFSPRGSNK